MPEDDFLDDLIGGGINGQVTPTKKEIKAEKDKKTRVRKTVIVQAETPKKMYKSYYLAPETIALINKVTLTKKLQNNSYCHGDAIDAAFRLLAKKEGI